MTPIRSGTDDNRTRKVDGGLIPLRNPSVANSERNHDMTDQSNRTERPTWKAPLFSGLVGTAAGAAIGAGTGMWWMMGVLGGAFAGFGELANRRRIET